MSTHGQSRLGWAYALVATAGCCCAARAGTVTVRAEPGVINLKSGDLRVAMERSALRPGASFRAGARYILVLDGPVTEQRRSALAAAGVKVGEYLPTHAVIADVSAASPEGILRLGFVTWAGEFQGAWKVQRGIGSHAWQDEQREELRAHGYAAINAVLFAGADLETGMTRLGGIAGVTVLNVEQSGGDRVIGVLAPVSGIGRIAEIPEIGWVEEKPEYAPRAYSSRWIVQRNEKDVFPLYDAGLHGEGQLIGIIDGWVSVKHCAFTDPNVPITEPGIYPDHRKIYAYNSETVQYDLHGTHVAGIAVGDAGDDTAETRGVAYLARMVFNTWPDMTEDSVFDKFALHHSQGANVHSNSWGSPTSTEYDFAARAIDNLCWLEPDNLILYAVSNGDTILNPENAKNCLAVTSCGNEGGQDSMCNSSTDPDDMPGRGPTTDGRRKPEIAAPGCGIISSSGQSCSTRALDGTSMAAPAVGASAVLMQQYYTNGYYPRGVGIEDFAFQPSGALLKATILNAGVDLPGEPGYPNDYEGWGRLQADNAMYFPGDTRRTVVRDIRGTDAWALATGKDFRLTVSVEDASEPLRVTMVFHDAPAALQAAFAPVNDLDLEVTSPSGVVYAGNLFADGVSKAGKDADAINNVEQVLVPEPELGRWTVRIVGREVNVGPTQGFAVVATGGIREGCPADFDQSGFVDLEDFDCFVRAFIQGTMRADFDESGSVEFEDFDAFTQAFEQGC